MMKFYIKIKLIVLLLISSCPSSIFGQSIAQIGNGNLFPSNTLYSPVYRYSATSVTAGQKSNILFTAAEMTSAGISNGDIITSIAFNKETADNFIIPAQYTVRMGNTVNTTLSGITSTASVWSAILSSQTTVFSSTSFNLPNTAGWCTINLTTPFTYTGGSLEISTELSMTGNGGATGNFAWEYTTGFSNYIIGEGTVAAYKHRPNIKFTYTPGVTCTGTPTAGTATVASRSCNSEPISLSLTGNTIAGGITLQWQSSPQGSNTFTDIQGATSSLHTVTNQTSSTDYRCIVTCTNSSSTSISNVVTALQLAGVSNFYENFDTTTTGSSSTATYPSCWSYIDDITTTGYGYVEASTALSNPNSFRLYRTNSTSNTSQNLVLISPETNNLGNGTKQLRFYAMATTTNASNILQIVSANGTTNSAAFTIIQSIVVDHTGYKEYIVPLPVGTDDFFAFRLAHNNTSTLIDINIDDVYYEDLDTCLSPTNLTVSAITQTTSTLNWTASTSTTVTGYEYEVRSSGLPGSGTTGLVTTAIINAPATTANVTGLSAITDYKVYIRSICGTTVGRWTSVGVDFTTPCAVFVNDFYEGFDSTATGSSSNNVVPNCWSYIGATSGYYGYTSSDATRTSGGKGFRYYKTTANATADLLLVSPETNNLGNGSERVRFWAKVASGTADLPVYRLDGPTSTATKTLLSTIPLTTTWTEYTINFPVTTDDYFAIGYLNNSASAQMHVDDVYYEDIPAPTLTTTKTNNLCFGESNGMASVVVKDGIAPLTYS